MASSKARDFVYLGAEFAYLDCGLDVLLEDVIGRDFEQIRQQILVLDQAVNPVADYASLAAANVHPGQCRAEEAIKGR